MFYEHLLNFKALSHQLSITHSCGAGQRRGEVKRNETEKMESGREERGLCKKK
jgi:hypothetical protein